MCGIVGAFGPRANDRELVRRMAAAIRHRGPDDTGEHFSEGAGLVMNRLAIIDLAGGNQPFYSADRRHVLVYNGEIYNFRELRAQLEGKHHFTSHCDTEVILHGYAEWGLGVFAKLNGIFAVALLDLAADRLVLARDPLGTKPLYLLEEGGTLFFASELKAFTDTRLATRVDLQGVFEFLAAGYVFGPHTAIAGTRQLEPGHYALVSRAGRVVEQKRFRASPPPAAAAPQRSGAEWREATHAALSKAVLGQTVADVPYGILLSSGIDSMAILCTLKDHDLVHNLETFTITYGGSSFDEGPAVAALAGKWGFRNTQMELTSDVLRESLDDVFHTFDNLELFPTSVAIYTASRLAGGRTKVLLAGNGGDELFGGYPTYRATELVRMLGPASRAVGWLDALASRIPDSGEYLTWTEKLRRFVAGCRYPAEMAHFMWRHLFLPDEIADVARPAARVPTPEALYAPQTRFDAEGREMGYSGLARMSYADVKSWLVDHGLSMWDKAGMRWSAEIRVPLVDPDFVDFVFGIPADVRMRPAGSKAFLRQTLAGSVPPEILALPKHGFQVPIAAWLRGPLREQFQALSLSLPESCFSRPHIERLWADFLGRGADNALKLWSLASLGGWASRHRLSWP